MLLFLIRGGNMIYIPVIIKSSDVWRDDFEGNSLDTGKWEIRTGSYDPDYHLAENITVKDSNLIITTKREDMGVLHYTSGWITSKQSWTYGRFEARIKLPIGKGLWPAFWLKPAKNVYGEGVISGELDIMELWGDKPYQVKGTIHYGLPWKYISTSYNLQKGTFKDDYHIFRLDWNKNKIEWYVDNNLYKIETNWYSSKDGKVKFPKSQDGNLVKFPYPAPFDQKFNIILNVGIWKELPPDENTIFPVSMLVDYVTHIYP